MRIIAGKFKGRTLITLPDRSIRPTTDRVKESIFNLIQWRVEGAKVLDLFCGSGAVGIEAISRGAESVAFVDVSRDSIATTKQNLTKVDGDYELIQRDYALAIDRFKLKGEKFDIIFLDPPYRKGLDAMAIDRITESGILEEGGCIVVERARDDGALQLPSGYRATTARDYGSVTVLIVEKASACAVTGTFDPFTIGHEYLVEKALENFDEVHVVVLINPDKTPMLPLNKRVKLIECAVRRLGGRVKVEAYSGLAIDYCKANDIQYIIRGVRNESDFEYEKDMAEWNYAHGGVTTVLVPAKDVDVSSTLVRDMLKDGEDVSGLVDESIESALKSEAKAWTISKTCCIK